MRQPEVAAFSCEGDLAKLIDKLERNADPQSPTYTELDLMPVSPAVAPELFPKPGGELPGLCYMWLPCVGLQTGIAARIFLQVVGACSVFFCCL
jgi:hypothetical protein